MILCQQIVCIKQAVYVTVFISVLYYNYFILFLFFYSVYQYCFLAYASSDEDMLDAVYISLFYA